MDIKSWKIMLAVDDYGSFTRVGAELGYTQSGITQMMKNLEKKVGFPLYIKDHHGICLLYTSTKQSAKSFSAYHLESQSLITPTLKP